MGSRERFYSRKHLFAQMMLLFSGAKRMRGMGSLLVLFALAACSLPSSNSSTIEAPTTFKRSTAKLPTLSLTDGQVSDIDPSGKNAPDRKEALLTRRVMKLESDMSQIKAELRRIAPSVNRLIRIEDDIRDLLDAMEKVSPRRTTMSAPKPAPKAEVMKLGPTDLKKKKSGSGNTLKIENSAMPKADPADAKVGAAGVHLASYTKKENAAQGWKVLAKQYPSELKGLAIVIAPYRDKKTRKVYYRLKAGPFENMAEARSVCAKLKKKKAFCETTDFIGK